MRENVYNVKVPEGRYGWGESAELEDYEFKYIDPFEWAVYYYSAGSYEGSGDLIAKREGKIEVYSLSHCSCNGPLDGQGPEGTYDSIENLENRLSEGAKKDLEPLINLIKEKGLK